MAATAVQPAGTGLIHLLPSSENAHQRTSVAPQQMSSESCNAARGSCFPAIPGGLRHWELGEVALNENMSAPHLQRPRQELLWRQFFLDPGLWWDNRQHKTSSLSPGFCHKDEQLATLDAQLGPRPFAFNSSSLRDPGPRRGGAYEIERIAESVTELCETGQLSEAVDALGVLVQTESYVSTFLFYIVLKGCVAQRNLVLGRRIHELIVKAGYERNTFLANHILRMYASYGRLQEAKDVFTGLSKPDAFSWSAVIAVHAKHGEPEQAIKLYQNMRKSGVKPDGHVFVAALQACGSAADLESGKQVHADVLESGVEPRLPRKHHHLGRGLEGDTVVGTCLVDMYVKCGRLEDAHRVFESLPTKDVVTWTAMIAGYAEHGLGQEALALYDRMGQETRVLANTFTFTCLLKACASSADLHKGKQLHAQILNRGLAADIFVGTCLVHMYAKCGSLKEAREVFDSLATTEVVTWNAMIAGYAEHGLGEEALALHARMEQEGVMLSDPVTYACLLKACASPAALQQGKRLHLQILERGLEADTVVGNCLVHMYAKCGKLEDARRVFDTLPTRNVATWNSMIGGYAEHGLGQEALALYARMEQGSGIALDSVTFVCLVKVCAALTDLQQGKLLHTQIVERGLEADIVVGASLVDMYVKCDRLEDAHRIFDSLPMKNIVTWTAMISGYADRGLGEEALAVYARMEQEGVSVADSITFACLLKACATAGALQQGKKLHLQIQERALEGDMVIGTCLVNMYVKCGRLEDAKRLFDSLPTKDVVTWTAMIAGYAEHGLGQEALALYARMEQEGTMVADTVTYACLLKACASTAALQQGKQLHLQILERGLGADTVVGNCLVEMYAKCGRLEVARRVVDSLPRRDVVTWTTMINGFGQSNEGHKAIECFQEMMRDGVQADETTFMCLLVACSHEGLVKEGQRFFKAMVDCGIVPTIEHYTCMVDLLGRAGNLDEAENMLLAFDSNDVGYMSLLNACKCHNDIERGVRCFESLIRSDSQNAAAYVLMGNIYADAGRWSDVERVERLRKSAGASKKPAVAGIEVDRHVHTFVVGEEKRDVFPAVRNVNNRLKDDGGHVPHTELVLKQLSEKEKENELCGHAEKLALAYGLMNTLDGTPLLVTKNLRMCGDCHSSTEIMSRIEKREIIVRDSHRVHRFVDGSCRCGGRP